MKFESFQLEPCPGWASEVWKSKALRPGTKAMLLGLALHMSELSEFQWPGKGYLAECLGVGEEAIEGALKEAREKGFLKTYKDMSRGFFAYVPCLPVSSTGEVIEKLGFDKGEPGMVIRANADTTWKLIALALADRKCPKCQEPITVLADIDKALKE